MSAFADIWIGSVAPVHSRYGKGWHRKDVGYWYAGDAQSDWYYELETQRHTMVVVGQLYEEVDMQALLESCVNYATKKADVYKDPAGHYIIFITDKQEGNKYVYTNRFGTYHAYWSSAAKLISTYYLGLAKTAGNKKLNWEGIAGFFSSGYFPGDTTYLEDVYIFSPASCYYFDAQYTLVDKRRYWQWEQPREKHVDAGQILKDVLVKSIAYAVKDKRVAVPVSGGLDSRLLAGVFNTIPTASYKTAWGFTYGYAKGSQEIAIGGKICEALQMPCKKKQVNNYLFDDMTTIADSVELFQYVDGTRQACMQHELNEDADIVIGGHWGDVWMDAAIEEDNVETALDEFYNKKVVKKGSSWLMQHVCKPYIANAAEVLRARYNNEIQQYKHLENAGNIVKAYKTDTWSFRWTMASVRMYQAGAMPVLPFYDNRVTDILWSVPATELNQRQFEIEFIKTNFPKLAAVKWQEYDANLYNYRYFNNRNYLYRLIDKVKRMVAGERISRNWELFYLSERGRKELELILKEPVLTDIVPVSEIDDLLHQFYSSPSAANGYTISMLHTFARFLKQLYGN